MLLERADLSEGLRGAPLRSCRRSNSGTTCGRSLTFASFCSSSTDRDHVVSHRRPGHSLPRCTSSSVLGSSDLSSPLAHSARELHPLARRTPSPQRGGVGGWVVISFIGCCAGASCLFKPKPKASRVVQGLPPRSSSGTASASKVAAVPTQGTGCLCAGAFCRVGCAW